MWYLATNEVDVFHFGELFEGAVITTGQPKLLYFETKEELENELTKYGQTFTDQTLEDQLPPVPDEN